MSIFFKDLGKKAKDLLSKNYTSDGSKEFSIKTKTSDGVTYSAKSTIDGGNVKAKVTTEFKKDKVNFKSLSLDCCGAFAGDITVDEVLDNVRLTLSVKSKLLTSIGGAVGFEYSQEDFKAKFVTAPLCKNASASVCYKHNDLFVGGSAGIEFKDGLDLTAYDIGVGYSIDADNVATLNVGDKFSTLKFSGYRQHSEDVALAATLTSSISDGDFFPAIELGGSLKIDSGTSVFGKVSAPNFGTKDLNASFALDQKLNANTSLSLTSVLDLDPGHPQKFFGSTFGVTLKFGA